LLLLPLLDYSDRSSFQKKLLTIRHRGCVECDESNTDR
jgi:hypothetical protein